MYHPFLDYAFNYTREIFCGVVRIKMVSPVRPASGATSTSNTQQSNDSAEVPQLGLANRLVVNLVDFFHDNLLHQPSTATVEELYDALRPQPLTNQQVFASNHSQTYSSLTNNQRHPNSTNIQELIDGLKMQPQTSQKTSTYKQDNVGLIYTKMLIQQQQ